jgi:hypothetical protein
MLRLDRLSRLDDDKIVAPIAFQDRLRAMIEWGAFPY